MMGRFLLIAGMVFGVILCFCGVAGMIVGTAVSSLSWHFLKKID